MPEIIISILALIIIVVLFLVVGICVNSSRISKWDNEQDEDEK